MAEKIADRLDAHAAFQQPQGEGVSQTVSRVAPRRDAKLAGPLGEQVADRRVLQCTARAARAQKQLPVATLPSPPVQIAVQHAQRRRSQRQDQFRRGLALLDTQSPRLEIHRTNLKRDNLGRTKAEIRHKMQDRVVTPARLAGPVDRPQQPLYELPRVLSDMTLSKLMKELGIPAVPHGFRSSFRDFGAECTDAPHAVMEMALAHKVGSAVEQAYARSDLFEKRCKLMEQWADYLAA